MSKFLNLNSRIAVLILCLTFIFQSTAQAAMTLVDVGGNANFYYDPASIKRNGSIVTLWMIVTYKFEVESKGRQVKSSKVRIAFDCKNERSQTQYNGAYSELDGRGELIDTTDYGLNAKWDIIDPDTTMYLIYAMACSGKGLPKPLADINTQFQKNQISEIEYKAKRDAYLKTLPK